MKILEKILCEEYFSVISEKKSIPLLVIHFPFDFSSFLFEKLK
jgi:hypothetical protein